MKKSTSSQPFYIHSLSLYLAWGGPPHGHIWLFHDPRTSLFHAYCHNARDIAFNIANTSYMDGPIRNPHPLSYIWHDNIYYPHLEISFHHITEDDVKCLCNEIEQRWITHVIQPI